MKNSYSIVKHCLMAAGALLLAAGCAKNGPETKAEKLKSPVLSAEAAVNSISVTWKAVANAESYGVSTDGGASWDETAKTSFEYTGLDPDTEYTVTVIAWGDGVKWLNSESASVTERTLAGAGLTKLAAPVPVCEANVRNAMILWEAVEHASGYMVSTDGGGSWGEKLTALRFEYKNLTPSTAYTVMVKAAGDGETYGDSDAGSVELTTLPEPDDTGEYRYVLVEEPKDIKPGGKYLIAYIGDRVRVMDNTAIQKPIAIDLSSQYSAQADEFPSNDATDAYAYTITDAGSGKYLLQNPAGKYLGWTSGTNFVFTDAKNADSVWEIELGNAPYTLQITNAESWKNNPMGRGVLYRYEDKQENPPRMYDLFGAYSVGNIDHDEYCEPCLYMHNKPVPVVIPEDPEPEDGETLMYVPVTDPDRLYSGDKCLVVYAAGGKALAMDSETAAATRPEGVGVLGHYHSAENRFESNASTDALAFTFTRSGGSIYITNPDGKYVTYDGGGTTVSLADAAGAGGYSQWKLYEGAKAGTIRITNDGNTGRSLAYNIGQNTFGGYSGTNLTPASADYTDPKLYVLRSVEDGGGEPAGDETGFPAQWDMTTATVSGGKCYAASGNTGAYITVTGAKTPAMENNRLNSAGNWNTSGAGWIFAVPVTNITASEVTVSFNIRSSNTGPRAFIVKYSEDGVNYTSTGRTIYCSTGDDPRSEEFIPAIKGFPPIFYIKLEVDQSKKAVKADTEIAADGSCRISGEVKLLKR